MSSNYYYYYCQSSTLKNMYYDRCCSIFVTIFHYNVYIIIFVETVGLSVILYNVHVYRQNNENIVDLKR